MIGPGLLIVTMYFASHALSMTETVLLYDPIREMNCSWGLNRSHKFQMDRFGAQMIEEANTLTQKNGGNGEMEFVKQTCLQSLLDSTGTMQGHIFLACQFLCFVHRALDAIGDEVILRFTLFHRLSCLRLHDNHRVKSFLLFEMNLVMLSDAQGINGEP